MGRQRLAGQRREYATPLVLRRIYRAGGGTHWSGERTNTGIHCENVSARLPTAYSPERDLSGGGGRGHRLTGEAAKLATHRPPRSNLVGSLPPRRFASTSVSSHDGGQPACRVP